jgi:hypothetical protein
MVALTVVAPLLVVLGTPWPYALAVVPGLVVADWAVAALAYVVLRALRWRVVMVVVGFGRRRAARGLLSLRGAVLGSGVGYVPRAAITRGRHLAVLLAPRITLLAVGLWLWRADAHGAAGGLGVGIVIGAAGRLVVPGVRALTAAQVAAMHVTVDAQEGGFAAAEAAATAYAGEPSVVTTYAELLLDTGDAQRAADAVATAWHNDTADPRERALAAATYAWALTLSPGAPRDEAWTAVRFALTTLGAKQESLTAFARVLLVSGYPDDAAALAREAAAVATADRWWVRADGLATAGTG